jgi:3-oxoacyl-[acyl-carrier protein] reductase
VLGFGGACAAVESMTRHLAAELSPRGVRVVALMPDALPETVAAGSHSREVFAPGAAAAGLTVDQMAEAMLSGGNANALLRRWPTLDQVARTAAFVASDGAGAITGQVVNLTSGSLVG